jgi:protein-S-isoprenylcysteine O-methyltransferase Ste14
VARGGWQVLGLIPISVGIAVYFICASDFITVGRGTPAPIAPPTRLVVRGLYRFVRNPMYVGVGTLLVGETIFVAERPLAVYTAVVCVAFHLVVLLYEEPQLTRLFGDDYAKYRAAVPRWIPRLTPAR